MLNSSCAEQSSEKSQLLVAHCWGQAGGCSTEPPPLLCKLELSAACFSCRKGLHFSLPLFTRGSFLCHFSSSHTNHWCICRQHFHTWNLSLLGKITWKFWAALEPETRQWAILFSARKTAFSHPHWTCSMVFALPALLQQLYPADALLTAFKRRAIFCKYEAIIFFLLFTDFFLLTSSLHPGAPLKHYVKWRLIVCLPPKFLSFRKDVLFWAFFHLCYQTVWKINRKMNTAVWSGLFK